MKKMFSLKKIAFLSIYAMVALFSCTKKDEPTPTPIVIKPQLVTVADYQANINQLSFFYPWMPEKIFTVTGGGYFSEGSYFAFDAGDTLILSYNTQNNDVLEINAFETSNLSKETTLRSYRTSQNDKIIITQKMVISVFAYGKVPNSMPRIKLQRMPKSAANQNFNTTITFQESRRKVAPNTKNAIRVGEWQGIKTNLIYTLAAQTNILNSSRTVVPISADLPPNTIYWIYRLVCNNAGAQQSFDRNNQLLQDVQRLNINPYVTAAAIAAQLLTPPPGTANCNVYLIDSNLQRNNFQAISSSFRYNPSYSTEKVKQYVQGVNILSSELYLGLLNDNATGSVDINLNIIAAVENWYLTIRTPIISG